jgi:hypothetical protein
LTTSSSPPQHPGKEETNGIAAAVAVAVPAPPPTMSSMLSAFSQWFVNPRRNPLARIHMLTVSSRLKKYGA